MLRGAIDVRRAAPTRWRAAPGTSKVASLACCPQPENSMTKLQQHLTTAFSRVAYSTTKPSRAFSSRYRYDLTQKSARPSCEQLRQTQYQTQTRRAYIHTEQPNRIHVHLCAPISTRPQSILLQEPQRRSTHPPLPKCPTQTMLRSSTRRTKTLAAHLHNNRRVVKGMARRASTRLCRRAWNRWRSIMLVRRMRRLNLLRWSMRVGV